MTNAHRTFEAQVANVLRTYVEGFRRLVSAERLSGGASQETYRLTIETEQGGQKLAMRRAPGGVVSDLKTGPTLAVEAQLMRTAKQVGVPEPEIVHVLEPEDDLGEGFIMEWLDGETLGARIVRSPDLDEIRPRLARACGEILARIHAIDVESSGLNGVLEVITPEELVEQTWERYKLFETPQPMIDFTGRWLKENLPGEVTP
ncbi:MAG: phosphotransferase family protein, partial [Gammaproteobacteria bacterium]|nr:phosphotransferase family protein [Gammaproteobacteria bacterium]